MKKMMRKNLKTREPRKLRSGLDGITVEHAGTVLSLSATLTDGGRSLKITPGDKMGWKERTIKFDAKFPVEMIMPSVEGTVIICLLTSGENRIYDTLTGERLADEVIELRTKKGEIHFYS